MKRRSLLNKVVIASLAIMIVTSVSACKKSDTIQADNSSKTTVQLKAFTMGKAPATGIDNFYKQLDALTTKDLGCTIKFDFIPWGDEKNKINLAIASGEYDLYVGGGFSDYKGTAAKGAFLDLKPLLEKVPDLVKHYSIVSNKTLQMCEVNGKLYGIPQFGKAAPNTGGEGFVYREDLRKKWGLSEITNLDTLEKYLYKAKQDPETKDTASITDQRFWTSLWYMIAGGKYMTVTDYNASPYGVVAYNDPYKVVSLVDTPEYKQVLQYAAKWYNDGIVDHDILAAGANATQKSAQLVISGKKAAETNSPRWSIENSIVGPIYKNHPDWELGWYDYNDHNGSPAYIPTISNATAISINAKSKNATAALKFIEKAHTDQTYYNLLRWGVQDENYKIVNNVPTTVGIDANNVKPAWSGIVDGYMEKETPSVDPKWQAITDKMKQVNAMPKEYSPIEGFTFNVSNLSTETAALETVRTQYMLPLDCGVTKDIDADLSKVKGQLKSAGLDKYLDEMQKQLNAFAANKSK